VPAQWLLLHQVRTLTCGKTPIDPETLAPQVSLRLGCRIWGSPIYQSPPIAVLLCSVQGWCLQASSHRRTLLNPPRVSWTPTTPWQVAHNMGGGGSLGKERIHSDAGSIFLGEVLDTAGTQLPELPLALVPFALNSLRRVTDLQHGGIIRWCVLT
jgi:hypothetical protein